MQYIIAQDVASLITLSRLVSALSFLENQYTCGQGCQRLAPYILGISDEACSNVGGTWCRRHCTELKDCTENKPRRNRCLVVTEYSVTGGGFNLTHMGKDCERSDDEIYLIISCLDENGDDCQLPLPASSRRRVLYDYTGAQHNESKTTNLTDFDQGSYSGTNKTLPTSPDQTPPEPNCSLKELTFTYNITYTQNDTSDPAKSITNFIKGRNGIQTDIFEVLENDTELSNGESRIITSVETVELCSNITHTSLVALRLENAAFNQAFDDFSSDLKITNDSEEEQCQLVRELLGFDPNYIDDNEICQEFYDIKCDYDGKGSEGGGLLFEVGVLLGKPKGGRIPGFQGFQFEPLTFEGFQYGSSEFVGFEFKGFQPSGPLTFQEVQKTELVKAELLTGKYCILK